MTKTPIFTGSALLSERIQCFLQNWLLHVLPITFLDNDAEGSENQA